jgi:hypoxanthine-DNA glycosylase
VSRGDARVLILGTLPGRESLRQGQYYANKQNSFWKIMEALAGADSGLPYADRLRGLIENRIALWDVCAAAAREGSLDANIRALAPNDFTAFFRAHGEIELICFNGQHAAMLFSRHVRQALPQAALSLPRAILPSTSPAHAGMRFEQKLALWREALERRIGCAGR